MPRWIWLLGISAVLASAIGLIAFRNQRLARPPPVAETVEHIRVEILNGCGTDGLAARVGARLRTLGFDVMAVGNAGTFNYSESIVIDRVGKPEYARRVAEALGIPNRIQQMTPDPFRIEEVTVVIGRDHNRLGLLRYLPPDP